GDSPFHLSNSWFILFLRHVDNTQEPMTPGVGIVQGNCPLRRCQRPLQRLRVLLQLRGPLPQVTGSQERVASKKIRVADEELLENGDGVYIPPRPPIGAA